MDLGTVSFKFIVCSNCSMYGKYILNSNNSCINCGYINPIKNFQTEMCIVKSNETLMHINTGLFFKNAGSFINFFDISRPYKED